MKITKKQFQQFENVRESGICNMFDTPTIMDNTDLTREEIAEIRHNYSILKDEYDPKEN